MEVTGVSIDSAQSIVMSKNYCFYTKQEKWNLHEI